MQVGICTFHADDSAGTSGYVARPFNFYVFPDQKSARARIVMHASTANFHKGNGFDFQKWISAGVPFLSAAEHADAARVLDQVSMQPARADARKVVLTRDDDKEFVSATVSSVEAWLASGEVAHAQQTAMTVS